MSLDPLYCHTCNRGNLDGPTIAACRREFCDARKTAAKLDKQRMNEQYKRERENVIDIYDKWSIG